MAKAAITSLDLLEEWFKEAKRPFWTLWEGGGAKGQRIAVNDTEGDGAQAWEWLENTLRRYDGTGGLFHVKVYDKATNNHGIETSFRLGGAAAGAGIHGIGGIGGIGIYGIPHEIEKRIRDDEREKHELRAEIDGLKAEVKNKGGYLAGLVREAMEYEEIRGLVAGFAGKVLGVATGTGEPVTDSQQRPIEEGDDEFFKEQNEKAQRALELIAKRHKDYGDTMLKVAQFDASNPGMADQLLKQAS